LEFWGWGRISFESKTIMPKLKDLHKIEWPREKLLHYGAEKLTKSELLAILLRTGSKGMNVIDFAKNILRKFPNFSLADADVKQLQDTFGVGTAKACEIVACFELGRRMLKGKKTNLILTPKDVWDNLKDIRNNKKEHFVVFYLDTRQQEIKREIISVGILNASLIHPREVFEPAIRHNAAQILVAHNHPSGDPTPSDDDVVVTKRLCEAGKILGIEVVDHVVVSENSFVSLKCESLL